MNTHHDFEEVTQKRAFYICRPHEGPEQYDFTLECVNFSDGISRFIYKSEIVPENYFPRMVYIFNLFTGKYERVGSYIKNEQYVFIKE